MTPSKRRFGCAGPAAAIDQLIEHLDASGDYRALLDALLLELAMTWACP